jgi:DNA mismatch endonuclease, patch repair protein
VSFNMSRVRGKNTKPEIALRRALRASGLRFRLHTELPGRPDVVFVSAKLAVFVDGEFWHGRNVERLPQQLHVRKKFWLEKIRANIERDRRNNIDLKAAGFRVIRLWGRDVLKDPESCAVRIRRVYLQRLAACGTTVKRATRRSPR